VQPTLPKLGVCRLSFFVSPQSGVNACQDIKDTFFPDCEEATGSLLTRDHSFARNLQSVRFVPPRPGAPSSLPEGPQREAKIRAGTPGTRISPMDKLCYLPAEIYRVVIANHRPVYLPPRSKDATVNTWFLQSVDLQLNTVAIKIPR